MIAARLTLAAAALCWWTAGKLLDWADAHAEGALFLHLHELPEHGPCFRALCEEVRERPRPAAVVKRTERAMLASDHSPQAYFEQSLSAKKRKELRRQLNRLGSKLAQVDWTLGEAAFAPARAMLGAYLGACAQYVDLPTPEPRLS